MQHLQIILNYTIKRSVTEQNLTFGPFTILIDENQLDENLDSKNRIISKYQEKECDIALNIKPLFWNPSGKEFTYINSKIDKTKEGNEAEDD